MALQATQVGRLADAYRQTLHVGDQELANSPAERKILHAIVASSAGSVWSWIKTRMPSGTEVGKPLGELTSDLKQGNVVGNTLAAAEEGARKQAVSAVTALIFTGTAPVWLASVLAFLGGLFGISQKAGEATGTAIWGLVLTGGPALIFTIRALVVAGPAAERALGAFTSSIGLLINDIGVRSEHIFRTTMSPAFDSILTPEGMAIGPTPVVNQLRNWARAGVAVAFLVFAGCAIFFIAGAVHAVEVLYNQRHCVRLVTGGCLGQ